MPSPRGGRLRNILRAVPRPIRAVLQVMFGLAVAGMLSLAVLFALVHNGPISVGFLIGPIAEAIREELGVGQVEIENALLRQSEDGRGIEFRLTNLRIKDQQGAMLAETPLAGINLSGAGLLRGRLVPASVEFIRPRLRLSTTADGGLALAVSRASSGETKVGSSETKAGRPADGGAGAPRDSTVAVRNTAAGANGSSDAPKPIDLFAALHSAMAEFRQGESIYLRELGLRDAVLTIRHNDHEIDWRIPGFTLDLQHYQKRSVLVGEGLIASPAGPWGLSFRITESAKARSLRIDTEIAELVPRAIAAHLPFVPGLAALDMPIGGSVAFDVSREHGVIGANLKLTLSPGRVLTSAALGTGLPLKGGALHLSYSGTDRRVLLHSSEIVWGAGRGIWSGHLTPTADEGAPWKFEAASQGSTIDGFTLDTVELKGSVHPGTGHTRIDRLRLQAGEAELALSGGTIATPAGAALQLEGPVGPVSLQALLRQWPKARAPAIAEWLGAAVKKARITGGTVRLGPPPAPPPRRAGTNGTAAATTGTAAGALATVPPVSAPAGAAGSSLLAGMVIDLDVQDIHVTPIAGSAPLLAEAARLRLDDGRFELTIPQARMALPSGRHLPLKDTRLALAQIDAAEPQAELTLQSAGAASALLELLDLEPFGLVRSSGFDTSGLEARADANLRAVIPVRADLGLADIKPEGRVRITDLRTKSLLGTGLEISGGTLLVGLSDKALDAKGDILVAGVPAKISWQRIFNAPPDRQPPARLTATLDAADRDTLGLAVNHIVQGDVPVVVTVQQDAQGNALTHLEANLGAAELLLETMAWRKAPGRPALLHTDIVRSKDGRTTELQNFKIVGDDIALDGKLTLDAKHQLRSFQIPAFAVNVLTKLEMHGRTRDDGVLEVKTKGTAHDGRAFFRSLFSAGQITDRAVPKHRQGLDLTVEIDTIVGFNDANLKNVQFSLKRRGEKIVALQANGILSETGVPISADIRVVNGARMLHATSADAGSAFRLIGLYSNMRGGNGALDVNLDARGAAEKTGRLKANQFVILGDPIVSEVIQAAAEKRRTPRTVPREQVEFEHLDVPFSIGHGQVVLGDSTINGPLLGARLNGKIDYNQQTVFLEGSYVPLYGLNSIPNSIPIIGDILSGGRTGDGLIGLNFQITGAMGRPQIIVNPLSVLTPGLFRQIWETAPQGHAVVPRSEPRAPAPPAQASSAGPQTSDGPSRAVSVGAPVGVTGTNVSPAPGKASSSGPQRVEAPPAVTPAPDGVPRPDRPVRSRARDDNAGTRPREDGQ